MAIQAALGALANNYIRAAVLGYGAGASLAARNGIQLGDFNLLQVLGTDKDPARLEISNLRALEAQLKEVAPELHRKFKRDLKKHGEPAAEEIRRTFRNITMFGPLGPVKRPNRRFDKMATSPDARLSWYNSITIAERQAIDVSYKSRNAAREFQKLRTGRDGTLSVVRVRIHAPAFIVADIAGASGKAKSATGKYTRYYDKRAQNGQVFKTRHRINADNVDKWLRALNNKADNKKQSQPSRYAWPTAEEYMPKYRRDVSKTIEETIRVLNQRMAAQAQNAAITPSAQALGRKVAA